jgi:uncharacterized membrane protein
MHFDGTAGAGGTAKATVSVLPPLVHALPAVTGDEPRILALSFDAPSLAHQALHAALALQDDAALAVHDAVVISGDASGAHVVATMDPMPVAAAVPGSLLGALVGTLLAGPLGLLLGGALGGGGGAIVAKLVDTGIPHDALAALRDSVAPGRHVLALLVTERHTGALAAFAMRCGTIGTSTIMPCR